MSEDHIHLHGIDLEERFHVFRPEAFQDGVVFLNHGRRAAGIVPDQRHLTEERVGIEGGQLRFPGRAVFGIDSDGAAVDLVQVGAFVSFTEDDLAFGEGFDLQGSFSALAGVLPADFIFSRASCQFA